MSCHVMCVLIHSTDPSIPSRSRAVYSPSHHILFRTHGSYFDAAPGSLSASHTGFRGADGDEESCTEEDIEREIDKQEAEDDEFLPFTANPR